MTLTKKPEWKENHHPHEVYSSTMRALLVIAGLIIGLVPTGLNGGSFKKFDLIMTSTPAFSATLLAVALMFVSVLGVAFWLAYRAEHKETSAYVVNAAFYPMIAYPSLGGLLQFVQ